VEIVATDLCRRYSARLIRDVLVGPSPTWLARRLELVGIRSINNVADATNYALMAYGHPLHAFDMDRLEGGKILVRRAAPAEPLTTLDGVERKLTSEDLVIADARHPVALAGIMGGQETEISLSTKNVLLESAWFEPVGVRRTSKRQAMHTEASHRFERGADIGATMLAANRCIELIQELAGGTVDPQEIDAYTRLESRKPIIWVWSLPPRMSRGYFPGWGFPPSPGGEPAGDARFPRTASI
jgi:phenylalanyl-tRNA synthetase beta chain